MGKIESQAVGRDERAGLAGVRPDDATEGGVKEMGGRVVAHRVPAAGGVHLGEHVVVDGDAPLDDTAAVEDEAAFRALRVVDLEAPVGASDLALVADLAALLGVERRLEEHELRLVALLDAVDRRPASDDAGDACLVAEGVVADEARLQVGEGGVASADSASLRRKRPAARARSRCSSIAFSKPSSSSLNPNFAPSSAVRLLGKP